MTLDDLAIPTDILAEARRPFRGRDPGDDRGPEIGIDTLAGRTHTVISPGAPGSQLRDAADGRSGVRRIVDRNHFDDLQASVGCGFACDRGSKYSLNTMFTDQSLFSHALEGLFSFLGGVTLGWVSLWRSPMPVFSNRRISSIFPVRHGSSRRDHGLGHSARRVDSMPTKPLISVTLVETSREDL